VAATATAAAKSADAIPAGDTRPIPSSASATRLDNTAPATEAAAVGRRGAETSAATSTSSSAASIDGAAAAQTPLASSALVDLALTEGSDATGSAASALQAAAAAAAPPPPAADAAAAPPFPALQISMTPALSGASGSSGTTLGTAVLASAAASLAGGGDARDHNGAGDSGSDTGSGFLGGDQAAALQQLSTPPASSSSAAAPVPTVSVHADVDSADFPQGVADKVSLAVDNGWSSAKLSVNPPQLGPIELQIAVQGAHAQVAMSTHSAVTREALESSVPHLRDMLNSQGFTQVSVDISQRSFQERSAPEQPYARTAGAVRDTAPVSSSSAQVSRAPLGILDTYA
jgi:flagellar hook-length control protein FliK